MLSNILDRFSFLALLFTVVLLPIFVLPFTQIPVEISKGLLLVTGLLISLILWTVARFYDGKINMPKSVLLGAGVLVVLVSLLSALFGDARSVSLFGVIFDVGTFWFLFAGFVLMLLSSILISTPAKARVLLMGVIISGAVLLVFQTLHLFFPQALSLGMIAGKTGNVFGSWSAMGFFAAFITLLTLFVLEFMPVSKANKIGLWVLVLFSLFIISAVNLILIWELLGAFALVVFVYKISVFSKNEESKKGSFPALSFVLIIASLLFLMSSQLIGGFLPTKLGAQNYEVRPSFGSTMSVTKEVLKESPILGVGPNRFGEVWALHKPTAINSTIFVDTFFNSGSGLIPTLTATTGGLGIIAWLLFLLAYLLVGVKLFAGTMKGGVRGTNSIAAAFFLSSLFLFIVCFVYPAGSVLFLLALCFAGVCIGLYKKEEFEVNFSHDPRKSFFSMLFLTVLMIASVAMGYKYYERFASVAYFRSALQSTSLDNATSSIIKAYLLHQNDLYFRTYAQASLLNMNTILAKGKDITEEDKTKLQSAYQEAVGSAKLAVQYDKRNYLNYQMLGIVHSTVAALGAEGANEQAILAFQEASNLNPNNPGLKLAIARSYLASNKLKEAKDFANQALTLKPDYVNALVVLSQISKQEGSLSSAISFAEKAVSLDPQNKELVQYLQSLRNNSAPAPSTTEEE